MDPQPLRFTLQASDPARSIHTPTTVQMDNWSQLSGIELKELRLTGCLEVSTATSLIGLQAWLAISGHSLPAGSQPKGSYTVELLAESAVAITATLTCLQDVSSLALELKEVLKPQPGA